MSASDPYDINNLNRCNRAHLKASFISRLETLLILRKSFLDFLRDNPDLQSLYNAASDSHWDKFTAELKQ